MGYQPYLPAILKLWVKVDEFIQNFILVKPTLQFLKGFALIWWNTDERLISIFEFLGDASFIIG